MTTPTPTDALPDRPPRLPGLAVVLLVAAVFAPGVDGEFVWDDQVGLVESWGYRRPAAEAIRFAFTTTALGHWQPLTWLSFSLDHAIWGLEALGFRCTNLVVHAVAALAVMAMASELLRRAYPTATVAIRAWGAGLAAALFAVHPLRVESVCWAIERRDLLSCAGLAASVWAYLVADRSPRPGRWRAVSIACFALSLLSKAWGVSLVAVLVAIDLYPARRLPWRRLLAAKLPYIALAIPVALLARHAQHSAGAMADWTRYPLERRVAQAVYGIAFYPWKTVLPTSLSPLYELEGAHAATWAGRHVAAGAFALVVTIAAIAVWRRTRAPLVAWVSYLALVSPVLGFFQSGMQEVADRYAIVATIPFTVLAAGGAIGLASRGVRIRRAVVATSVLAVGALGALATRYIPHWRDERALWTRVLEIQPTSWMAHHGLGLVLHRDGDNRRALRLLERAAALGDHVECYAALGMVRLRTGAARAAVADLDRALAIDPRHAPARYHRALARRAYGDRDGELEDLARATELAPEAWKPWGAYGRALAEAGRIGPANAAFARALEVAPDVARSGLAQQRAESLRR